MPIIETNAFSLTDQELTVVRAIADGLNTKEIAGVMKLSPKTVEYHRAAVMAKLKISDIPTLVRFAVKHNLVNPKPAVVPAAAEKIQGTPQLAQALLAAASAAAAGTADVLQVNALCQVSDALIRLARLQMEANREGARVGWLTDKVKD